MWWQVGNGFITAAVGSVTVNVVCLNPGTLNAISITPTVAHIMNYANKNYNAIGTFTNGVYNITHEVYWNYSNHADFSLVSYGKNSGLATSTDGVNTFTAITASFQNVTSNSATLYTTAYGLYLILTNSSMGAQRCFKCLWRASYFYCSTWVCDQL